MINTTFTKLFKHQLEMLLCIICVIILYWLFTLYADDIILVSPSVAGLQCMLDWRVVADDLSLEFYTSKSHAVHGFW